MSYDVIVVGARVAGSPTAMLLARSGYRVLAVDRATFPSDTLSTHVVHAPGVAALRRWGLLDRLVATGCPPLSSYRFDFGGFALTGTTPPVDGVAVGYAPRRTVLDALLVQAAVEAGVEVREGCNVESLVVEEGRVVGIRTREGEERARVVVGADGRHSRVAAAVGAPEYNPKPRLEYTYFTYFSGLPTDQLETYIRPDRGFACAPTHDGLTMVVMGWPYAQARAYKADVEGNFHTTLRLAPEFAQRVSDARREAPFLGGAVPAWLRRPYGEGWVLVGDAAYNKDPITAQGISDAFLDAERCARAVDRWLGGGTPWSVAMRDWHEQRDAAVLPMYELTAQFATLAPPPAEVQHRLGQALGDQAAMDDFMGVVAGVVSPMEFFAPAHDVA